MSFQQSDAFKQQNDDKDKIIDIWKRRCEMLEKKNNDLLKMNSVGTTPTSKREKEDNSSDSERESIYEILLKQTLEENEILKETIIQLRENLTKLQREILLKEDNE